MPKLTVKIPAYRRHSSRHVAFVVINGKRIYLPGKYGSSQSRDEYKRLVREWELNGRSALPVPDSNDLTITELVATYWDFAERHYVKSGRQTEELACLRAALRPMVNLFGPTFASEFGPKKLATVRESMIEAGLARGTINKHCSRIRRLFRWAVSEELLPVSAWQSLSALPGLQAGRTKARETAPILPVPDEVVDKTLPLLPPVVADMVRLQRATGMRPSEVASLRPCDIDRCNEVWRYTPAEHKMMHKGRSRVIFIGPKGQAILLPYLLRGSEEYCFSPEDSEKRRLTLRHAARKTPLGYGNTVGTNRKSKPRMVTDRYKAAAYRRAITRACERGGVEPWAPNRLRHAMATEVRAEFGIEAAQTLLGHAAPDTTLIYAERSEKLAAEVAKKLG